MSNDVVWVALISASGALVAAITTQFLATSAAAKQAARTAQQEALQWQRSEAKRMRDLHEARLRELWAHVLLAQARMQDALDVRFASEGLPDHTPDASVSAASAAAQAYGVALIGLPGVRTAAKAFYLATTKVQAMLRYEQEVNVDVATAWRETLNQLEAAVIDESTALRD